MQKFQMINSLRKQLKQASRNCGLSAVHDVRRRRWRTRLDGRVVPGSTRFNMRGKSSTQRITNKATELARKNVKITRDEIDYLRKQMVVGGSTLDAALSDKVRSLMQN